MPEEMKREQPKTPGGAVQEQVEAGGRSVSPSPGLESLQTGAGHDVFISYSRDDKLTADALCSTLESEGIRCWIAPRDVALGADWGETIVKAIGGCHLMVLVFSSHANDSPQVRREVQRAFEKGLTVIPLRVEDVKPAAGLEYYMGAVHWLDALTPPLEAHLQELSKKVKLLLQDNPPLCSPPPLPFVTSRPPPSSKAQPLPPKKRSSGYLTVLRDVVIIQALTAVGGLIVAVAGTKSEDKDLILAIAFSNLILGTIGFVISGCLTSGKRWKHLAIVAAGVWLTSIVNVLLGFATVPQWIVSIVFSALIMGLGGGISYIFRRS